MDYEKETPDTWTNNIFSYASGNVFDLQDWTFGWYTGDYNLFFNRSGNVTFDGYASLSAWRTASGNQDDVDSIEADPQFNNPSLGDFTIPITSPAHQAASDGSDIGAWPYGSTPPPPPPPPECTENWQCDNWSTCVDGQQSRTCTDLNNCGTTVNQPPLTRKAVPEAARKIGTVPTGAFV